MIFTGKNLDMVVRGLELAIDELHNQIATCPDVNVYAKELDDLETEKAQFERLLQRVRSRRAEGKISP